MFALLEKALLYAPIWSIGLTLFAAMLLFAWIGSSLRRRLHRNAPISGKKRDESQEGLMVSSVMALLALLIGFTFSLAIARFDARRGQVVEDANAIGTTYLRTQMLEAPYRDRLSALLVAYTDNRIALVNASAQGSGIDPLLARNGRLITALWSETLAAFPSIKGVPFSNSYLDAMNHMIDMDTSRQTAARAHVPAEVYFLLFLYQLVAAGVVGYVMVGPHGCRTAIFLFFLFSLSQMLVIDIDRPTTGGITVSQRPMLDLREMMRANPPAMFDRPVTAASIGLD